MPSMANITVKNSAGTDVVYNVATGSAGDRIPARWTQNSASGIVGFRPAFEVVTRDNGNGTGRRMEGRLKFPVTEPVDGRPTLLATVPLEFSGVLPTNVDAAHSTEAFVQFGNLIASTLIRAAAADGYAPT